MFGETHNFSLQLNLSGADCWLRPLRIPSIFFPHSKDTMMHDAVYWVAVNKGLNMLSLRDALRAVRPLHWSPTLEITFLISLFKRT